MAGVDVREKSRPPIGIQSSDHPALSKALYRLIYPAHTGYNELIIYFFL
jgi:hypothetical protein